jgi:adenylate cyclase
MSVPVATREARERLADTIPRRLTYVGLLSNGLGASVVFVFLFFLGPGAVTTSQLHDAIVRNVVAFVGYMSFALPGGRYWAAMVPFEPVLAWLRSGEPASQEIQSRVLRYPMVWALRSMVFWAMPAVGFGLLNVSLGVANAIGIMDWSLVGGVTACALQYLLVERAIRPVTEQALGTAAPSRIETPGVSARILMAWTLASGVAFLGILGLSVADLVGVPVNVTRLEGAIAFLSFVGLTVGLTALLLASRGVASSLGRVRDAFERLERGDLGARVTVDDGSEVGLLQAGFNTMAAGLEERERIREAFGTYVDPEIAQHILREGTDLRGEEVEATVMFLDVCDFTSWAERTPAPEVVATLNRLFEAAVPIIHAEEGHVDKYVGDGLMAVFGAPRRKPDHADRALAAALAIERVVADEFRGELRVGIGLNSGRVVAGNVGGSGRLEFSVIGDAVNVAARVEAATRQTDDTVLLTETTVSLLGPGAPPLEERDQVELKGKSRPVTVYAPAGRPRLTEVDAVALTDAAADLAGEER